MNTAKVTRFEVIGEQGRALVRYGVEVYVTLQDDGQTLKVFLADRASQPEQASILRGLSQSARGETADLGDFTQHIEGA